MRQRQNYGYDKSGNEDRPSAEAPYHGWDIDHAVEAFFAACDGQGSFPAPTARWTAGTKRAGNGCPPELAVRVRAAAQIEPYWTMASNTCSPTTCFRRISTAASSRTSIRVAAYASHAVNFPAGIVGLPGRHERHDRDAEAEPHVRPAHRRCFDNQTIGDGGRRGRRELALLRRTRSTATAICGSPIRRSPIYQRPRLERRRHQPAVAVPHRRRERQARGHHLDHADLRNSDHAGMRDARARPGSRRSSTPIGKSKFWNSTAIFVHLGRLGRLVRSGPAGLRRLRRPRLSRSADRDLAVREERLVTHTQYETASVLRFIEDNFGLARLQQADARANDPANDAAVFNFSSVPAPVQTIAGSKPAAYWLHEQLRTERRHDSRRAFSVTINRTALLAALALGACSPLRYTLSSCSRRRAPSRGPVEGRRGYAHSARRLRCSREPLVQQSLHGLSRRDDPQVRIRSVGQQDRDQGARSRGAVRSRSRIGGIFRRVRRRGELPGTDCKMDGWNNEGASG